MDLNKLNRLIDESGYKKTYIADQLGLTLQGLINKLCGKYEFKVSEINKLADLLEITDAKELERIFFSDDVAWPAT